MKIFTICIPSYNRPAIRRLLSSIHYSKVKFEVLLLMIVLQKKGNIKMCLDAQHLKQVIKYIPLKKT